MEDNDSNPLNDPSDKNQTWFRGPACLPCRSKKLRCSRARPTCAQCQRSRAPNGCVYPKNRRALSYSNYRSACSRCRQKKTRCNGEKPRCSKCATMNADCEYPTTTVVPQRSLTTANIPVPPLPFDLEQLEPLQKQAAVPRPRCSNACLRCRSRKIACDGAIPACSKCSAASAPCAYTLPKQKNSISSSGSNENQMARSESSQAESLDNFSMMDDGSHSRVISRAASRVMSRAVSRSASIQMTDQYSPWMDHSEVSGNQFSNTLVNSSRAPEPPRLIPIHIQYSLLDLFFKTIHGRPFALVEQDLFLLRFQQGLIPTTLLAAIFALAARMQEPYRTDLGRHSDYAALAEHTASSQDSSAADTVTRSLILAQYYMSIGSMAEWRRSCDLSFDLMEDLLSSDWISSVEKHNLAYACAALNGGEYAAWSTRPSQISTIGPNHNEIGGGRASLTIQSLRLCGHIMEHMAEMDTELDPLDVGTYHHATEREHLFERFECIGQALKGELTYSNANISFYQQDLDTSSFEGYLFLHLLHQHSLLQLLYPQQNALYAAVNMSYVLQQKWPSSPQKRVISGILSPLVGYCAYAATIVLLHIEYENQVQDIGALKIPWLIRENFATLEEGVRLWPVLSEYYSVLDRFLRGEGGGLMDQPPVLKRLRGHRAERVGY